MGYARNGNARIGGFRIAIQVPARIGKGAMKYYIYISDAKVDMLLPQIPHDTRRKIATEIGFDLKVLSAKRKSETDIDDNRVTRLEAVVSFIREYGNLGTVDEPDEYFEGNLPLCLGPLQCDVESHTEPSVVYFAGRSTRTIVGLGGSARHMIGNTSCSPIPWRGSDTWIIHDYLEYHLRKRLSQGTEKVGDHIRNDFRRRVKKANRGAVRDDLLQGVDEIDFNAGTILESAAGVYNSMEGPVQQLEFIAKRLQYGRFQSEYFEELYGTPQMLVGTPLYVAMAE